ncbi:hypothetical protein Pint_06145 [Pistacia integerrima]|uniref:Uncharacterized protein n=1 Tax=Pistacia integerrima TaxID=434235 RepID=A0ACC0Z9A8_9ROSI|nr:hypothetical protein Pint_06145 [Pistacia integerrima]
MSVVDFVDPHSYASAFQPLVSHISFSLYLDFPTSTIHGAALVTVSDEHNGPFFLDTRSLTIHQVLNAQTLASHPWSLSPTVDPIKGQRLDVPLNNERAFLIFAILFTRSNLFNFDFESLWCAEGRVVEVFEMNQPIPPYLFAFAVGELGFREVGPRTRVYAESVPAVLDAAALEFAGTEEMIRQVMIIKQAEKLFGDYEWERFDLLVLPPSFPYGGMENPRMVFLTPTVIKGDASGAQVVAHELAHSWTGNLITNQTNEHFWLNEGFTTYAERRIVEVVQGEDKAALKYWDWCHMRRVSNFYGALKREIGRPAFDEFLKKYITTFKFKSIDTQTFLKFLVENVPGIEKQIDLELWTEGTGIPPDGYEPVSSIYTKIVSLANEFKLGKIPREDEVADWKGQEWELYLGNLPKSVEASQINPRLWPVGGDCVTCMNSFHCACRDNFLVDFLNVKNALGKFQWGAKEVLALDERYRLSESKDYEVKVAFLQLAILSKCRDYYGEVEKTLKEVGRMKYLRPLYTALVQGAGKEEEKILAKRVFNEAHDCYHPIAQGVVESIFAKHL